MLNERRRLQDARVNDDLRRIRERSLSSQVLEKELSWLSFNARVLQEAADPSVPVIERVRFLGIYSNNLDEFFRVRVADLQRRILVENSASAKPKGISSEELLLLVNDQVQELADRFNEIYLDVMRVLARRNIFLLNEEQLNDKEGAWLRRYFRENALTHITPILISEQTDLEHVIDDEDAYLLCAIHKDDKVRYALVEIPSDRTERFIQLPRIKGVRRKSIIVLDNAIRYCIDDLFGSFVEYDRIEAYSIKMTRDAEFDLERDVELSVLERMSQGIKQRVTNQPVRLVYDEQMPGHMYQFLVKRLDLDPEEHTTAGGRYRNFKDFIGFPNVGPKYLENPKLSALNSSAFDRAANPFEAISGGDILLYYPYHKFKYFTEFVRTAAYDPAVRNIKISIYRVASKSQILKSLVDAVKNGKKVTVIVELRARFDEQANIEWARILTDAGIEVEFGVPSLKCHAKIVQVEREEQGKLVSYAHFGTGNFNEKTARIYTDFALFTKDPELNAEVEKVFDFIINPYKTYKFKHLIVSPNHSRNRMNALIEAEIDAAKAGKRAEIFLKVNNLVDKDIARRLYAASKAGVQIRLIVRGMCSIRPGVKGLSENIKAISVVDRFLEHPRVSSFYAGGERKTFISSADWMTRNIDYRVEVGVPIYDKRAKKTILDLLELQWRDTTKARVIDAEQKNQYVRRGNRKKIRSQFATHDYLKQLEQLD